MPCFVTADSPSIASHSCYVESQKMRDTSDAVSAPSYCLACTVRAAELAHAAWHRLPTGLCIASPGRCADDAFILEINFESKEVDFLTEANMVRRGGVKVCAVSRAAGPSEGLYWENMHS